MELNWQGDMDMHTEWQPWRIKYWESSFHRHGPFYARFEVLSVMALKVIISQDVTPCILVDSNQHDGGTWWLHHHGRRVGCTWNRWYGYKGRILARLVCTWFALFCHDDGGSRYIQNVDNDLDCMVSYSRDH